MDALDLAIERPVLLVAGPNAAGKTTIRNALQFVLCDDLCRIQHKKNIKALLREGAKLGHVTVGIAAGYETGGRTDHPWTPTEYTRSAVTGHYTSATPPPEPHPALGYLLDPPAFLALSGNERREFLFHLMNVSLAPLAVMEKLEKRGHDPALLARIAPQLRHGFTVAHTEAQGLARGVKGEWRGVTGTDYGEVKAESWAAQAPAATDGAEPLRGDLAILEKSIEQAQRERGAFQARREEAARLDDRLARIKKDAEHVEEYATVEQALRQSLDGLVADERKLTDEIEAADSQATFANISQGTFLACPECGAALCYDRGHLKPGKPATKKDMDALAQVEQHLASRRRALETLRGRRKTKESELLHANEAVARARSAKETLASFEIADGTEPPEETADAILTRLEALKSRREKLRAEIEAHEQARAQATEAETKTERARRLHEEIKALVALAADLAPDGLPAELLAQALGPINIRLADSSFMTGWERVAVSTDAIHFGERPLELASGSERWRATAMIAEAIAMLSGVKCFVLDGLDILDAPSRAQALAWLVEIAPEHESIICMATLKSPPTNLPDAVQLCWLGPPPAMTKAEGQAFDEARVQAAGESAEEMAAP